MRSRIAIASGTVTMFMIGIVLALPVRSLKHLTGSTRLTSLLVQMERLKENENKKLAIPDRGLCALKRTPVVLKYRFLTQKLSR